MNTNSIHRFVRARNINLKSCKPILQQPVAKHQSLKSTPVISHRSIFRRTLHLPVMSSDAEYASFLDKANESTEGSKATTQSKPKSGEIKKTNTNVPKVLEQVDEVYVSDADEAFEPISLKYTGDKLPSADELGQMIGESVESIDESNFHSKGQYKSVVDAVKEAGDGNVEYFKAELDRTRVQYLVISLDSKNNRLVGLTALAIES